MSRADIETLRDVYQAVSRGDWDAAFQVAWPDFELRTPDQNLIAGTWRDGKPLRAKEYTDRTEALEAAGLSE